MHRRKKRKGRRQHPIISKYSNKIQLKINKINEIILKREKIRRKNASFLFLIFKEYGLWPALSSPQNFRIPGGYPEPDGAAAGERQH